MVPFAFLKRTRKIHAAAMDYSEIIQRLLKQRLQEAYGKRQAISCNHGNEKHRHSSGGRGRSPVLCPGISPLHLQPCSDSLPAGFDLPVANGAQPDMVVRRCTGTALLTAARSAREH